MSQQKKPNSVLQTALTALMVFLGLNLVFSTFFPQGPSKLSQAGDIGFLTDRNEFSLHENVTASIQNNSKDPIIFNIDCPNPPAKVLKLHNSNWEPQETKPITTPCGSNEITLKPGEKHQLNFSKWTNSLFDELGYYKLTTTINGKIYETNQFEIKPEGAVSWLWTTAFYQPIYNILIALVSAMPGKDLGLAIIVLTIIIRTILLIPSQKALKSQRKLQHIQPKIEELKKTHGSDQQTLGVEMMKLYKEHKVSPLSSCLPMLIQFPILIALFYVIQNGLNPDQSYLLYDFAKHLDISAVNTNFLGILELTKINFIALPIIVGVLQYLQMKLSLNPNKTAPSSTPSEMKIANSAMTIMMPVLIGIFTASVPAGVGVYWGFSTLYGIVQQLIVNKQVQSESTQIREVSKGRNKSKKQAYKDKHQTHSSKPAETSDNDNTPEPPVTKIKI